MRRSQIIRGEKHTIIAWKNTCVKRREARSVYSVRKRKVGGNFRSALRCGRFLPEKPHVGGIFHGKIYEPYVRKETASAVAEVLVLFYKYRFFPIYCLCLRLNKRKENCFSPRWFPPISKRIKIYRNAALRAGRIQNRRRVFLSSAGTERKLGADRLVRAERIFSRRAVFVCAIFIFGGRGTDIFAG